MSKTTITSHKTASTESIKRAVSLILIYGFSLLAGFALAKFGLEITLSDGGKLLIGIAVSLYAFMGYFIWGTLISTLETIKIPKKAINRVENLKKSLKKVFYLLTVFLFIIVFITVLTTVTESINNWIITRCINTLLNATCIAYIINCVDAICTYPHIRKMKKGFWEKSFWD